MRFFGVVICLAALVLTGYSAVIYKAPTIQKDIRERTERALAENSGHPVEVIVDGRHVTLRGTVSDDQAKEKILSVANDIWGGLGPIDELKRLTVIAPYRFEATKSDTGETVVRGLAPSIELKKKIDDDVKAIFGPNADVQVDLAAGVPDGDWRGVIGLGLDALATLEQGKLVIVDQDVSLVGLVAEPSDVQAVDIFVDAAPDDFFWTNELSSSNDIEAVSTSELVGQTDNAIGTVDPFTFKVIKNVDGSMRLSGFAPDDAMRQVVINEARSISGDRPVAVDIRIAKGMPNSEWPDLVFAGIGAMAQVEAGTYEVIGDEVTFAGDVVEEDEPGVGEQSLAIKQAYDLEAELTDQRVDAPVEPAEQEDDLVASTTDVKPQVFSLYKSDDGKLVFEGAMPDKAAREELVAAVTEKTGIADIETDIELNKNLTNVNWQESVVDRAVALTMVKSGSLSFTDGEAHLVGVVDTPEDIEPTRFKIAEIDSSMTVDLKPVDPRKAATVELVVSPGQGVTLWGNLPGGLTEEEAAKTLGLKSYDGGLSQDGRGRADVWREDLAVIGSYLPQFVHVGVKLSESGSKIEGKLHQNSDVDQVKDGLAAHFADDQNAVIEVSTTELSYDDGAKRKNPLTGNEEIYDRGYWLPIVSISSDLSECRERSSEILASNKITFLRGKSKLDARAEKTVDSLAAVAIKCLQNSKLSLEIGGHTDTRGSAALNQALSQERADVIFHSLTARGVDPASIAAIGYGPDQPIADNATTEGRAKNRRITFEWKESGTEG